MVTRMRSVPRQSPIGTPLSTSCAENGDSSAWEEESDDIIEEARFTRNTQLAQRLAVFRRSLELGISALIPSKSSLGTALGIRAEAIPSRAESDGEPTARSAYTECMELPDLPPDLTFPALGNTAGDIDFAFRVKQAALGPHVTVRWGWNETFQRAVHERRFNEKPFFAIERAGRRLGTISIESCSTHLRLGEFYLLPAFQGRGLGTAILRHCLTLADALRLPVRLEYLRWNPGGSLYRRCGFVELGRTDVHCLMERPSTSPPPAPP